MKAFLSHAARRGPRPLGGPPSSRRDFAWTLIGNVAYALSQWAIVVVLARLGSADMVGQFALGTAISLPVMLGTNLYLRAIVATDVRAEYAFADYLGLRLLTTLCGLGVIVTLVGGGTYSVVTAWVIVLVGVSKAFDAVSDLGMGLFQQRGRMDYLALMLVVNGGVSFLTLSLALWWTQDIVWATLGSLIGSAVALVAVGVPGTLRVLEHDVLPRWHVPTLRRLAGRAAPLGVASLRSVLSLNIPRYVIAYALGERDLGIFTAIASLVLSGQLVTSSLTLFLTPRLAAYAHLADASAFRGLTIRLVYLSLGQGIAGVALALVAGPAILSLVFGAEYAPYQAVLVWMALSGGLATLIGFLELALTAMGRLRVQMHIQVFTLAVLAALCFRLTPSYGIRGAAIATCGSALLSAAAYGLAFTLHFRHHFGPAAARTS